MTCASSSSELIADDTTAYLGGSLGQGPGHRDIEDFAHNHQKLHKTGRREAVRNIVEGKSHQKNMPDSTVTLPRPRNAVKN